MPKLGQYELLGEIARGGMGVVYRARGLLGEVAIKRLTHPGTDPRLVQEAQAAIGLRHPGIVATHHLDLDAQGHPFLVMELVEGESLKDRLQREGPLPVSEAVALTRRLCDALAHAHERGVVHRDLKPANVLVDRAGQPKIADFGLGKLLGASKGLTESGATLGTPGYMPPEQAGGDLERVGPASDVYSLGATLYALLTGRPPFRGNSPVNTLYAILKDPPSPPSALRSGVSPHLDDLVLRCLAKRPQDRPASAAAVGDLLDGLSNAAAPPRPSASRALLISASVALAGLLGAGAIVLSRPATETARWLEASPPATSSPSSTPPTATPSPDTSPPPSSPEPDAKALLAESKDLVAAERWQEALRILTHALELERSSAAYNLRASVYAKLEQHSDQVADLVSAARLLPDDPERASNLLIAAAYIEIQTLKSARSALVLYDKAAKLHPYSWKGFFYRARARHECGQLDAALQDLDEADHRDDEVDQVSQGKSRTRRGQIWRDKRDLAQAEACFDEAIRLTESGKKPDAFAYFFRGDVRYALGNYRGCKEDMQRMLEIMPSNPVYSVQARRYLQALRDY
jgi:serine/threonine protein kinase